GREAHEITKFCPHCGSDMNIQYQMSDLEIEDWIMDHEDDLEDCFGLKECQDIMAEYEPWEIIKIIHDWEADHCFDE
ncbi:MAG: hypothetical protein LUE86_05705, partial [Clostridiales bacterium]|nr:hypothetical protein [Clostridiales bacterium]